MRAAKGSPEALAWAENMRARREAKKQGQEPKEVRKPAKLSPSSVEAGVMQPSGESGVRPTIIRQLTFEEAERDLEELGVDDWVKKHYDKGDYNIDSMAEMLRESREDIFNRLHAYGYPLPEGTYSA